MRSVFSFTLLTLTAGVIALLASASAAAYPHTTGFLPPREFTEGGGLGAATGYLGLRRQHFGVENFRVGSTETVADQDVKYEEVSLGLQASLVYDVMPQWFRRITFDAYLGLLASGITDRNSDEREDTIESGTGGELGVMSTLYFGNRLIGGLEFGALGGIGLSYTTSEYERSNRFDYNRAEFRNYSAPMIAGAYGVYQFEDFAFAAQGGIDWSPAFGGLTFRDSREFIEDAEVDLERTRSIGYWISTGFIFGDTLTLSLSYHWGPSTGIRLSFGGVG